MNFRFRRKIQAIALGGALIVTQCCCCILPIRLRVEQNSPPASVSAQASVEAKEPGWNIDWDQVSDLFSSLAR